MQPIILSSFKSSESSYSIKLHQSLTAGVGEALVWSREKHVSQNEEDE
jgi:hypothetical protein